MLALHSGGTTRIGFRWCSEEFINEKWLYRYRVRSLWSITCRRSRMHSRVRLPISPLLKQKWFDDACESSSISASLFVCSFVCVFNHSHSYYLSSTGGLVVLYLVTLSLTERRRTICWAVWCVGCCEGGSCLWSLPSRLQTRPNCEMRRTLLRHEKGYNDTAKLEKPKENSFPGMYSSHVFT